jgi:Na+/glutamate symporter
LLVVSFWLLGRDSLVFGCWVGILWFLVVGDYKLITNNKQQTTNNKQQITNNKQQTTNNKQQTTNNKQQTTKLNHFYGCANI